MYQLHRYSKRLPLAGQASRLAPRPGVSSRAPHRPSPRTAERAIPPLSPLGPGAEFDRIRGFLRGARARAPGVVVGPGDDCAVVTGAGIALSCDLFVEDVHFRRSWLSPREIGWRAATAALSDLAAVAARPIGVLASLAVAAAEADDVAAEVMEGVREAVEAVGGVLLGGDLTRSPGPLLLDVTAVGETAAPVLRSGARTGDEVWVTGELGAPGAAVERWTAGETPDAALRARFARPAARTAEARWLAERGLPAAMLDLSDGLAGDAGHLAAASGAAILLRRDAVPVHPAVSSSFPPDGALRLAMEGGEEYELCFAARAGEVEPHVAEFLRETGLRLTRVGRVARGEGVWWETAEGRAPLGLRGFQHFGEGR